MSEETDALREEMLEMLDEGFRLVDERLDTQEQLLSGLMKAYVEMNVAVEGIIAELMNPRSEEEQEEFRQNLNKRHRDMMQTIAKVSDDLERSGADEEDPSASILRMVGHQDEDTSSVE